MSEKMARAAMAFEGVLLQMAMVWRARNRMRAASQVGRDDSRVRQSRISQRRTQKTEPKH